MHKFHWGWRGLLCFVIGTVIFGVGARFGIVPVQCTALPLVVAGAAMIQGYAYGRLN